MVSKEPNCLPTTNSHSNGNPEKSATMTVRSVLLNRNSPDIESRLKRRRNRTQQVRFKDLDDGDGSAAKPERRSPHPGRKSPASHCPASSWRDEVANGPSLVGSVRGDMESTIGAVEEFLKRAPRHPLTPGPTRRSWAPPRPCSLTLPLPRQPCMSTAIQTSPSLQKSHSLPRSQSLGSSIRADWDEDEDEEDLLVGIVTPISSQERGHTAELGAAGSATRRNQADQPCCPCTGEDSAASSDPGERPCSCPTAAPKSIPGRYRGRRRRISRTASDPGRADSPAVSPARAVSPCDHLTRAESPCSSPPGRSPPKSSPTQTQTQTQTEPPAPTSPEKATSCSQPTESACIPQQTAPTCVHSTAPASHNSPIPCLPNCVLPSQGSPPANAALLLDSDSADSLTSPPKPTPMTQTEILSSASETLPRCTNLTQSVPACKSPTQPVPSCQTPTQPVKVKTPTQTVPSFIPAAKSLLSPQNNTETIPPSVALTQYLPTCETPRQTIVSCETPTQPVKAKTPTQTMPSSITVTTPLPTNQNPTETMSLSIPSTQTLPNTNASVQPASNAITSSQHTTPCKSPTHPVSLTKTSKPVSVCENPKQSVPICKTPAKTEPASSKIFTQPTTRSKTPTLMEPSCKIPVQSVADCTTPLQPTQLMPVCMTLTQSCNTTPLDCISPTQHSVCKTTTHTAPTPKTPTHILPVSKIQPMLDCMNYTEIAGPGSTSDNTGSYLVAAQVPLPCNTTSQMPPCISERNQETICPSSAQAVTHYFNTTNSISQCVVPAQIMPPPGPSTNALPACIVPESAVPPYVTQQTIQVCSSPFKIIAPGILPNQTSSPNFCVRQVTLSQTVTPVPSSQPACPAAYLQHAAPPYGSSPRASPASSQAPPYTTQDRKLPPPPPPPPPYTPRKKGATATGQTRRPPTPKVSVEKDKTKDKTTKEDEKEKEKEKVGNGVLMQHLASGGHICRKALVGAEGGAGVGVPCLPPRNSTQAAIRAATMGARRALFGSEAQACASQCPRPRTPCGQQQSSSCAQDESQADTLRHVQELLGGLMSGTRCKLDLTRAKEKLLGPNGPLYDISSLQSQLHSLEGVLETSQNTIKVLLDVIQDLEKKEAERDGRHSYRTGQDIENCGTCRDCACIIYSVEHDFRLQEGQVTRAWRVPEPQEAEQGSPQTVLPPRNQDSPQSVKKSRKKCFWFL